MTDKRIKYYDSFSDDFFQTDKKYTLKKNYTYIRKGPIFRILSSLTYCIAFIISSVYCRLFLNVSFVGAKKLRKQKGGFFIYGNHTQPVGDVFNPALACVPKRIYTVVSVANMYLPVIGKLLPYLGALPLPTDISDIRHFTSAIEARALGGNPIVIYPEGHLWAYHTEIRPFMEASFRYPVSLGLPSYSMTTTYQRRKHRKKPKITVYIDGPFYPQGNTKRDMTRDLCLQVKEAMTERTQLNTCRYITYKKREPEHS